MPSRKASRFLSLLFVVVFLITGCAAPAAPVPAPEVAPTVAELTPESPPPTAAPAGVCPAGTSIRIALPDGLADDAYAKVAESLNDGSKPYQIELEIVPASAYQDVLKTQLAAGDAPDVFWMSPDMVPDLAGTGLIAALDDYIASDSPADWSSYAPVAVNAFAVGGKLYGMPAQVLPLVAYANLEKFKEAGVANPEDVSYQELVDAAIKQQSFASIPAQPGQLNELRQEFIKGGLAMVIDWADAGYESQMPAGLLKVLPLPTTAAWVSGFGISANTKTPECAYQALKDLLGGIAAVMDFSPTADLENLRAVWSDSNITWYPYPELPGPEIIGDATLVPGAPAMLAGVAQLQKPLGRIKINVARTVVLEGTYSAPIGPEDAPVDEEDFWKRVDSGGVTIGVLVEGDQAEKTFVEQVHGSKGAPEIWLVDGSGDKARVITDSVSITREDPSVIIPTAGIDQGSTWCKKKIDGFTIRYPC